MYIFKVNKIIKFNKTKSWQIFLTPVKNTNVTYDKFIFSLLYLYLYFHYYIANPGPGFADSKSAIRDHLSF